MTESDTRSGTGWRGLVDTAASIAVAVFCIAATWNLLVREPSPVRASTPAASVPSSAAAPPRSAGTGLPLAPISLEGAASKGSRSAPVAIVEFSDFQCPYCASFAQQTLPEIEREYVMPGKVLVAFRHLPLPSIHPFATAEVAVCASEQEKFWPIHDIFFTDPKGLNDALIRTAADAVGLDRVALDRCRPVRGADQVRKDVEAARALGIRGTPTLLIGRLQANGDVLVMSRVPGAATFDRIRQEIERVLAQTRP